MKKDAYYFPHFCNARHDRKIKRLQKDLGMEGYGIFFMLLEVLREQTDFKYPCSDIDLLADEFSTSTAKIEAVVNVYDLFKIDETRNFFSPKLIFYLQPYLTMKEQRRLAGIKSGEARRIKSEQQMLNGCSTEDERMLNENEQSKVKESKVNESKLSVCKKSHTFETFFSQYLQKMQKELVDLALLRSEGKDEPWQYAKGILNKWQEKGYTKISDIPKQKQEKIPQHENFDRRNYTDEELEKHYNN